MPDEQQRAYAAIAPGLCLIRSGAAPSPSNRYRIVKLEIRDAAITEDIADGHEVIAACDEWSMPVPS